jgi:aryl-alcohol dehydrogenase-like predicted oxidoreductase
MKLTRSAFLQLAAGAALAARPTLAQTGTRMQTRKIPSTGQDLPVVGVGTWQTFDIGTAPAERAQRADVLKVLFEAGGSVIDSSPMYGRSEGVVGDLLAEAGTRDKAFLATKVWTHGKEAGIAQMTESLRRLRTDHVELMQIHNMVDWREHLPTLRAWKQEGRIGLLGITHYTEGMHGELEAVLRLEKFDFVQINYALDDRGIEHRLLRFARENGVAVIVNQPFGGGGLLRKLLPRPLPGWAGEIGCTSWAQILLKFVLAQPAVTCVIPGTGRPEHMRDNVKAGFGPYPDAGLLDRMTREIEV